MITNFNAVSDDKFLVEIPDADDINHIVVFMTGAMPFPGGMGAAGRRTVDTAAMIQYGIRLTRH